MNAGITLKAGQKLIGEGVGLASPLIAAGAAPVISNATLVGQGGNIPVVSLADNNEVAGIQIVAAANDAIRGSGVTGFNIHDNNIPAPAREGIRMLNPTGTGTIANNVITASLVPGEGREGIKITNIEDLLGDPVLAPVAVTATVTVTGNTLTGAPLEGRVEIRADLDGAGTNVSLAINGNNVSNSGGEGIQITAGPAAASVSADVIGNTLLNNAGVADFQAQANGTAAMCVELINNGNAGNTATFDVDNNGTGLFQFFESANDQLAVRSINITTALEGACGVP
jgi:hypothetical protein